MHSQDEAGLSVAFVRSYGAAFRDLYVVPMSAAVWSVPGSKALHFPVQMLVRFWLNHHLLDVLQRPLWRVIKGRSQAYLNKALESIHEVRTSTPVTAVTADEQQSVRHATCRAAGICAWHHLPAVPLYALSAATAVTTKPLL
jgi:predicted NAD/FAD-binding protein